MRGLLKRTSINHPLVSPRAGTVVMRSRSGSWRSGWALAQSRWILTSWSPRHRLPVPLTRRNVLVLSKITMHIHTEGGNMIIIINFPWHTYWILLTHPQLSNLECPVHWTWTNGLWLQVRVTTENPYRTTCKFHTPRTKSRFKPHTANPLGVWLLGLVLHWLLHHPLDEECEEGWVWVVLI